MTISERIKYQRKFKKITQKQLADRLGTSSQVISNWERAYTKPDYNDIKRLASALEVSSDYLLGRVDTPEGSVWAKYDEKIGKEKLKELKNEVDLLGLIRLFQENGKPIPVPIDEDYNVNIQIYSDHERGYLNSEDAKDLNAMIKGFLYNKKFISYDSTND